MHSGGNASSLPLVGGAPEPTINQLSKPGRRASRFPKLDVPVTEINNPAIRNDKPSLPEVSEHDLVMHYSRLAHRNFAVDIGFYPLGSCTMKYNPRFADFVAGMSTFANSHPATPAEFTQGNLEVLHELVNKGNTHFKHALEWNYFVGVILFYLFTRFLWKRTT